MVGRDLTSRLYLCISAVFECGLAAGGVDSADAGRKNDAVWTRKVARCYPSYCRTGSILDLATNDSFRAFLSTPPCLYAAGACFALRYWLPSPATLVASALITTAVLWTCLYCTGTSAEHCPLRRTIYSLLIAFYAFAARLEHTHGTYTGGSAAIFLTADQLPS